MDVKLEPKGEVDAAAALVHVLGEIVVQPP
jgi:hypothetical protein